MSGERVQLFCHEDSYFITRQNNYRSYFVTVTITLHRRHHGFLFGRPTHALRYVKGLLKTWEIPEDATGNSWHSLSYSFSIGFSRTSTRRLSRNLFVFLILLHVIFGMVQCNLCMGFIEQGELFDVVLPR